MMEEWLDRYFEKFGDNYPLLITTMQSSEEIIADIKRCIESGTPAKPIEYDDEFITY